MRNIVNRHAVAAICGLGLGIAFPLNATEALFPNRVQDFIPSKVNTMYEKGLAYLAKTQKQDGSWDGTRGNEPGVVGLAVVAFLAKGEDPNYGAYAPHIRRGIQFLLKNQNPKNGYIGNSMYNHGFATLALAECYGMVHDKRLESALFRAVQLIVTAQANNRMKAWRYSPEDQSADSSVTGCQLVALLAARNAGVPVSNAVIEKGLIYLKSCQNNNGSYGYTSPESGRPTLTAVGVLCQSLAKDKESAGYQAALNYLKKHVSYRDSSYPYYYEYYMSQALFHADEEAWKDWNEKNIRYFSASQMPDGSWAGSFGPTFSTAGVLLSLAVNYRFLPIYEK